MGNRLFPHRRAWLLTLLIVALAVAMLFAMDRPPICTCGHVALWHGVVQSEGNSQHLTDWYSPSHLIHGLLFYFFAWVLWTKWKLFGGLPAKWALPIAVAFEAFWELLENSPMIIDRYRSVTISWGYTGDSVVNSMADIGWMVIGFLLASSIPAWISVLLALALELLTLVLIRDNLTLNVLMLVWPVESIAQWQAAG
jgi:hypothetical protein